MLKIFDVLRAGNVKRWHLVEVTREQRLSEHLFAVAALAGEIATRMGMRPIHVQTVMTAALFHDIEEVVSGDPPTQTKRRIKEAGVDVNTLFGEFKVVDIDALAETIPDIHAIIKCADHLDTVFFLRDHWVGDHAKQALGVCMDSANEYFKSCGRIGKIADTLLYEHFTVKYMI